MSVDHFLGWPEAIFLRKPTTEKVIEFLEIYIARHGTPQIIKTNPATIFRSKRVATASCCRSPKLLTEVEEPAEKGKSLGTGAHRHRSILPPGVKYVAGPWVLQRKLPECKDNNQEIAINFAETFQKSIKAKKYLLVSVDHFLGWPEAKFLRKPTAEKVIEFLEIYIARHGIPQIIKTNPATIFRSKRVATASCCRSPKSLTEVEEPAEMGKSLGTGAHRHRSILPPGVKYVAGPWVLQRILSNWS